MTGLPSATEMQQAYLASDHSYDGIFYLGVRTTGIFCKPSCQARKPRPENVEYFATPREALFAGYRPCKRCQPLTADGDTPAWVRNLLHRVDEHPEERIKNVTLLDMGIDPARARRFFQKKYGMTFQAYCRGRRLGISLQRIRTGADLDDVALSHGYESHSGFREAFIKTFGTPPGQSRTSDCIVVNWIDSPLGPLIAGANAEGVCLLEFADRRMIEAQLETVHRRFKCAIIPGENEHIALLREELRCYFAGTLRQFSVNVICPGSSFQEQVWQELRKIPYGTTVSYEDIARSVGSPAAVRAVGTANGMNRICIVIPCHRVVNKNGELGGYGGGLWRKRWLLALEQRV